MTVLASARGKLQEIMGRTKTSVGRLTGNQRLRANGYKDRLEGHVRQVPRKIKRAAR